MKQTQVETAMGILRLAHQLTALGLNMLPGSGNDPVDPKVLKQALELLQDPELPIIADADVGAGKAQKELLVLDPSWFKPNAKNRHLSEAGEAHIYSLFDQGMNPYQAAKAMGINNTASRLRHEKYLKMKGKQQ